MKTSFAKYGFKKEELEGLAEIVAANLTDEASEEDINNAVSGAETYAALMQKVSNRAATEVEKKYKKEPPTPEPPTGKDEETAKLLAAMQAQINALNDERNAERLQAKLKSDARLKNIPAMFVGQYNLGKEEDLDAVVTKIDADFTALKSQMLKDGIVIQAPAKGNGGNQEPATSEEIKSLVKGL